MLENFFLGCLELCLRHISLHRQLSLQHGHATQRFVSFFVRQIALLGDTASVIFVQHNFLREFCTAGSFGLEGEDLLL